MYMQNYFLFLCVGLCFLCLPTEAYGQASTDFYAERLYVATDKSNYIAGESLWGSVFCMDAQTATLSSLSSVAYIELCDAQKSVWQGKAALQNGRGSFRLLLPSHLPTGNYLLRAYTRYMQNEGEIAFFTKVISLYNVLTGEKTDQTMVAEEGQLAPDPIMPTSEAPLLTLRLLASKLSPRSAFTVEIENPGEELAHCALSVYALDPLEVISNPNLVAYSRNLPAGNSFSNNYIAEYEGEIISGHVMETSGQNMFSPNSNSKAYLSVVGNPAQPIEGQIDATGRVSFYTSGIYGIRDMATELYPQHQQLAQIILENAFANYTPKTLPPLRLYPDTEETLLKRGMSMQLGHTFFLDTLHTPWTPSRHQLLSGHNTIYILDHYTRFPLMREVITEFVTEARIRPLNGKDILMVRLYDGFGRYYYADTRALVLLDGVPVFNHESILNFDPLLVERITIYDGLYNTGTSTHYGVIDIKTYKGNLAGMGFPETVRITSFEGLQYPLRFKGPTYDASRRALDPQFENLPDWRHSLYWDADLRIEAGKNVGINCYTSDYAGDFVVVIEGLTVSGKAFHQTASFKVKE